ncbi:MAG: glycosyltransferase family 2 protein [Acidimicrobiales bacterium]
MSELAVVVPTFNRAEMLDRCLSHLARQTIDSNRYEVVVADDASEDATAEVARRWAVSGDLDLTYRRCEKGYAGAARNRGVEASTAARILFLGDDVLAAPDLLQRHLEGAERHGPSSVLVGRVELALDDAGRQRGALLPPFMRYLESEGVHHAFPQLERMAPGPCPGWYFYACNASLPRAAFDAVGGFDESIRRAWEDGELGFRLDRAGYALRFLPEATATHVHPMTIDRYVGFLRAGRQDVATVIRRAWDAGEDGRSLDPHPILDRVVSDRLVDGAARFLGRVDRGLPGRWRHAAYGLLLRYEERRAYQMAAEERAAAGR